MSDSSEFSGIRKTSEVKIQDSTKQTEVETSEYSDANETENTSVEATGTTETTENSQETKKYSPQTSEPSVVTRVYPTSKPPQ